MNIQMEMPIHYFLATRWRTFHFTLIFHQLFNKGGLLSKLKVLSDNTNCRWYGGGVNKSNDRRNTWKPSFTESNCRIGFEVGRRHRFGSHRIVLLNANPDISTWNLRSLLLFSFVCHPSTWLPLHTGPSKIALFLLGASMATGQVPKRL